jgi:SAM-dependent methyltransferase
MSSSVSPQTIPLRSLPWVWVRWLYRTARILVWLGIDAAFGIRTTPVLRGPLDDYRSGLLPSLPSGWLRLFRVLYSLHPSDKDVFLDLGCGAGRAVLVAALLPFRRVVGVEIDEHLLREAHRNVEKFRFNGKVKVELVPGNLNDFALGDDVTVLFSYNTLTAESLERWMGTLFSSLDRAPRRLQLVYMNPALHDPLMASGHWLLLRRFHGLRPSAEWERTVSTHVYEARAIPIFANRRADARPE